MTQTGKLTPNLDRQSTKVLNLTVLQRIDPYIEEILLTAAHVTFYDFDISSQQWSRKDVEGSLFVVKRNAQPRFQFIVMNRRNTENLVENLLGDFEYEIQKPYLLYRNASQAVNGIWFYNQKECEEVADLFSRILNAYSKAPSKPKVSSSKSDFEELEAVSNTVIGDQLEPPATATYTPEDSILTNFFNTAASHGTASPNLMNSRTHHHPSTLPLLSPTPTLVSSLAPTPHVPPLSLSRAPSGFLENPDLMSNQNPVTNLLKPSSFLPPPSASSSLMMPAYSPSVSHVSGLHSSQTLQRQHSTPMLQPFPPPNPPPSLTHSSSSSFIHGPMISRDKVRNALLSLVQDDQFIDMFYHAFQRA